LENATGPVYGGRHLVKTGRDGEADGAVWPAVYNGQNNVKVLKLLV